MEPRKDEKQKQMAPQVRKPKPKPKFQIVRLEERIAPRFADIIDGTSNTLMVGEYSTVR